MYTCTHFIRDVFSNFFEPTFLLIRFKISQDSSQSGDAKLVTTYKPGLEEYIEKVQGVKQRETVDPAIHLLVQHGADTNKKDR